MAESSELQRARPQAGVSHYVLNRQCTNMHDKTERRFSPAAGPGGDGNETGYRSPHGLRKSPKPLSLLGWSGTPGTQEENPVRPLCSSSRGAFHGSPQTGWGFWALVCIQGVIWPTAGPSSAQGGRKASRAQGQAPALPFSRCSFLSEHHPPEKRQGY